MPKANAISVAEVFRLLKAAPSLSGSLRLAAKLRKAARDRRPLADGRVIISEDVDEAMDEMLAQREGRKAALRVKAAAAASGAPDVPRHRDARPDGGHDDSPAVAKGGVDAAPPQSDDAALPQRTDDAAPPQRMPRVAQRSPAAAAEERPARSEDPTAPKQVDRRVAPPEVRATVINPKYNYVDRVWSSPDAASLPRPPPVGRDDSLPADAWLRLPHVAVNGMTNSGKSTLINHCLKWDYAAKASSRAGRTTSIDFYVVNGRFVLVDLPGYPDPDEVAYIGVMKNWEQQWGDLVTSYFEMCANRRYDLRLLLHLQLSKRRPSIMCTNFVDRVTRLKLPMLLVMTKDDQLRNGHEERNYFATQVKKSLRYDGMHLHYTAETQIPANRKARKQLQRWIRSTVQADSSEACCDMLRDVWEAKRAAAANAEIKASSTEAPAEEAPAGELEGQSRTVTMRRNGSEPLGIEIAQRRRLLMILRISHGTIHRWNATAPSDLRVQTGEYIVEVNGVRGTAEELMQAIQWSGDELSFVLVRPLAPELQHLGLEREAA